MPLQDHAELRAAHTALSAAHGALSESHGAALSDLSAARERLTELERRDALFVALLVRGAAGWGRSRRDTCVVGGLAYVWGAWSGRRWRRAFRCQPSSTTTGAVGPTPSRAWAAAGAWFWEGAASSGAAASLTAAEKLLSRKDHKAPKKGPTDWVYDTCGAELRSRAGPDSKAEWDCPTARDCAPAKEGAAVQQKAQKAGLHRTNGHKHNAQRGRSRGDAGGANRA